MCLLVGVSLSLFAEIAAQTTTSGAVTGVITDQTNAVVPNADVEIKDLARGTAQSTKTPTWTRVISGIFNALKLEGSKAGASLMGSGSRSRL
jgi:hypothetical protein